MSMNSADTPNTTSAQPFMMASFHQRAPPPNSVATIRPRSSHDGGVPLRVSFHMNHIINLDAADAKRSFSILRS